MSLVAQMVKNLPAMQETQVQSPGEENGNPLQYSFLEDPMDTGAWQAIVYRAAKRWTRLKQLGTCISMPYLPQVNLTTFPHSFQGPFNY